MTLSRSCRPSHHTVKFFNPMPLMDDVSLHHSLRNLLSHPSQGKLTFLDWLFPKHLLTRFTKFADEPLYMSLQYFVCTACDFRLPCVDISSALRSVQLGLSPYHLEQPMPLSVLNRFYFSANVKQSGPSGSPKKTLGCLFRDGLPVF